MSMPSEQEIQEVIDGILNRREFGGPGTTLFDEPEQSVREVREPRTSRSAEALPSLSMGVVIALVAAALLLCGYLFVRREQGRRMGGGDPARGKEARTAAPNPLQAALDLAARGEYGAALVQLFALHLNSLAGQGWILLEKSKTNRQYELELMGAGYRDLDGFREFKQVFNGVRFGGRGLDAPAFESWLGYCRRHLQGGAA